MRKKSHISLARYLANNMQVQELNNHRKAFYLGSILPDLKPSFLTKRHTIDETYEDFIEVIKKITVEYDITRGIDRNYARHLGVITHYLSDYCTYPHNSIFKGNIKEHVLYEKELKNSLRKYLLREDTQRPRQFNQQFSSFEEIVTFIKKTHKNYLNALKEVHIDIKFIVELCYKVVEAVLIFFEKALEKLENELIYKYRVRTQFSL